MKDVFTPEQWNKILETKTTNAEAKASNLMGWPSSTDLEKNSSLHIAKLPRYHWRAGPNPFNPLPFIPYYAPAMDIERDVIEFVRDLYKGENCWGYVEHGTTNSNRMAIITARAKYPDGIVYFSDAAHYGIPDVVKEYKMEHKIIPTNNKGAINVGELINTIDKSKPAIVIPTLGTTITGAIDDVKTIINRLDKVGITNRYIHCDAALHGNYLPFMDETKDINFSELPIDSLAISPYKAWGSTTINSIYLVRNPLLRNSSAEYVFAGEGEPYMLPGSRSGLDTITAMDGYVRSGGRDGMEKETKRRMELTKYAADKFKENRIDAFINPNSTIIAVTFPNLEQHLGAHPEHFPVIKEFMEAWQLKTEGNIASIVISGHHNETIIDNFAESLRKLLKTLGCITPIPG